LIPISLLVSSQQYRPVALSSGFFETAVPKKIDGEDDNKGVWMQMARVFCGVEL
jgi:hypothetical protein